MIKKAEEYLRKTDTYCNYCKYKDYCNRQTVSSSGGGYLIYAYCVEHELEDYIDLEEVLKEIEKEDLMNLEVEKVIFNEPATIKKIVERRPRSYGVKSRKDFTKEAEGFEIVKEISICTNCAKRSE